MFCFHKWGKIEDGYQYCAKCGVWSSNMTEAQWEKWKKIAEKIEELTNIDLHQGYTVEFLENGNPLLVNFANIDEESFLDSEHTIQFGYHDGENIESIYATIFKVELLDEPKQEKWEVDPDEFLKLIKVYQTIEIPFGVE